MAIRFACPSCQQPIEIDDEWAGQSVGCPYCNKVVTTPKEDNWPAHEVPTAHPAGPGFNVPPPPPGFAGTSVSRTRGSTLAAWALTMSITCALLSGLAWLVWIGAVGQMALDRVGPNPTDEQLRRVAQEIVTSGAIPTNPVSSAAGLIGALCGLGGLYLGVRSLLRQERRRVMAIAAIVISCSFVICAGILMIGTRMQAAG